jgi:hypothetical protein
MLAFVDVTVLCSSLFKAMVEIELPTYLACKHLKKSAQCNYLYSQTCVQRPPLGPEKSGRLTEVSDKTEI